MARERLIEATARGERLAVMFAVDAPLRFSHWAFVKEIDVRELHKGAWETRCAFEPLQPVNPIWEAIDSVALAPSAEQLRREEIEPVRKHRQPARLEPDPSVCAVRDAGFHHVGDRLHVCKKSARRIVFAAEHPVQTPHHRTSRSNVMGIIQVTATVRNPAEPDRTWDGLFLVDTGSTDCVVPASALRSVGLQPEGSRTYELADGRQSDGRHHRRASRVHG